MNFSFRTRLIALITATIVVCVVLVAALVESTLKRSFELADQARTNALVDQFNAGFESRGAQIAQRVDAIANSEQLLRIGLAASQPQPDFAPFVNDAQSLASAQQLDLLEILTRDGKIISSSQWPARFGYKEVWFSDVDQTSPPAKAFLKSEDLPEGNTLALVSIRRLAVRGADTYIVGGQRLDAKYFQSMATPPGLRPVLYRFAPGGFSPSNVAELSTTSADSAPEMRAPDKFSAFVQDIWTAHQSHQDKLSRTIDWTGNPEEAETFHSSALVGRNNELLGALLVATPMREQVRLSRHVRNVAFAVGLGSILFGILLSFWAARHVTRPIVELAAAADRVAAGDWNTWVDASSSDEVGRLATAFNHMTHELLAQRDQLVQTERVAAWRDLARRLAHELKNPLFPLQITVENLLRARETSPAQFEEVFRESTTTLLAELQNLKNIVGRFSDFSKMPTPQLQPVDVNQLLRETAQLYQAQFAQNGRVRIDWRLADSIPKINADPVLLRRAFENLILNAMDVLPDGGVITLATSSNQESERVTIDVSDSGSGLKPEECERLFTPYYTTKQHGTGLGLAIVQSVVSDHNGAISVKSEKSAGTTFHIELPIRAKGAV